MPLSRKEQYVEHNGKPLNLLGFITVDVQVGKRNIKKARLVIARDGKRFLIGRDWLTQLNFHVAEAKPESEYNNIINHVDEVEITPELKQMKNKFTKLFERQGKTSGQYIKNEFKEGAKITATPEGSGRRN